MGDRDFFFCNIKNKLFLSSHLNGQPSSVDFLANSSAPRFQLQPKYSLQQEITPSCLSFPSFLEEDTIFRKAEVSSQEPLYLRPLQLTPLAPLAAAEFTSLVWDVTQHWQTHGHPCLPVGYFYSDIWHRYKQMFSSQVLSITLFWADNSNNSLWLSVNIQTQKIPSAVVSPALCIRCCRFRLPAWSCWAAGMAQVRSSQVLQYQPGQPLPSPHSSLIARGQTGAPLADGMSTLLAEICQHPKCPKGTFSSLCSTAYSEQQGLTWALKLWPQLGQ